MKYSLKTKASALFLILVIIGLILFYYCHDLPSLTELEKQQSQRVIHINYDNSFRMINSSNITQETIISWLENSLDIIEFKTDPDTKIKLSRLRNWISEISKSNISIKEMEEKLEYLLLEYSNQMNLHKLEYHTGTIETLVTVSLSLIENISRLKLSQASKVLFDLNRTKLKLLKAENEAPGKEVAFINKLNQIS